MDQESHSATSLAKKKAKALAKVEDIKEKLDELAFAEDSFTKLEQEEESLIWPSPSFATM
jgi:hypothetical protein